MSKPMKVKVECRKWLLYTKIFGIYPWCSAAPSIFDILFGSWEIWQNRRTLPSLKIKPKQVFQIFWTNHSTNFNEISTFDRVLKAK